MRITLRQLMAFDAVARLGSVSEAACEINLTQSATSMALQELERHLDCTLFNRQKRRLILNEHGRKLQPKVRSVLLGASDIEQLSKDRSFSGTLTVGVGTSIGTYLLPDICANFLAIHPHVKIQLDVRPALKIIDRVDALHLDIGFIGAPIQRPSLRTLHWQQDELVIFAAPTHRLAGAMSLSPQDLKDETWCLTPAHSATRTMLVLPILKYLPAIKVGLEANSPEVIKRLVRAGAGIGCLSRRALEDEFKAGVLRELPVEGLDLSRDLSIISRKDIQLSDLHEEFIRIALAATSDGLTTAS
ncbi:MAG: LysR substrate-binding domain-containing protein [Rhodocyclaceae bacterium]|jgi:DNA-binding transcriptional LysR family regulator|nr:LysR substrate-binding domain-containing protein [Rhodocyclaceae bacterium]